MRAQWVVEIRPFSEDENDPGFRRMPAGSEREAEKIERGTNINLNHRDYYTRIVYFEPAIELNSRT